MNKKQEQKNSNNRLQKKPINPERALAYLDFSFCVVRMPWSSFHHSNFKWNAWMTEDWLLRDVKFPVHFFQGGQSSYENKTFHFCFHLTFCGPGTGIWMKFFQCTNVLFRNYSEWSRINMCGARKRSRSSLFTRYVSLNIFMK